MSYNPVEVNPDASTTSTTAVEEKPYSHNHHHHHHHNQKKKDSYYQRYVRDGSIGAWICIGFFGIFFLTTIILLIVYGVQWNETNYHMHQLEIKMATENSRLTNNGIFTVSNSAAHHKIQYSLSYCHLDMYQLSENEEDPLLVPMNSALGREEQETYFIQSVLSMQYNVEPDKILIDGFKGKGRGKYMILDYEFLSNYPEFSTIRLVESSLDIYEKSIRHTKDIILCSNNPSKRRDAPRCSRLTTADDLMILNSTDFFPMESSTKLVIRDTPSTFAPTSRDMTEEEEEEEEEVILEDDITDLRFYELYCYRETDDKDDDFIEYLSLIVKPSTCRTQSSQ